MSDEQSKIIQELCDLIDAHALSIRKAAKRAGIRKEKFLQFAQKMGYEINHSPGRPIKGIDPDLVSKVHEYKKNFNVGYQRCAEVFNSSQWTMRAIFESEGLFTNEAEYCFKDEHPYRFLAKYVGQIWHVDLHYLDKEKDHSDHQRYLLAFIDDRSRYICHFEILDDKSAISTSKAVLNALCHNQKPYQIVADNGKEFIGSEFQKILDDNNILAWHTKPYTPEQNGKIERWWKTMEGTISDYELIPQFIDQYNTMFSHRSLKLISPDKKKARPFTAWSTWEHWEGKSDLGIIYENAEEFE
jgi:hypothetical protein